MIRLLINRIGFLFLAMIIAFFAFGLSETRVDADDDETPIFVAAFAFCTSEASGSNQPVKVLYDVPGGASGWYYLDYRPVFERVEDLSNCAVSYLTALLTLPECSASVSGLCLGGHYLFDSGHDVVRAWIEIHQRLLARLTLEIERVNATGGRAAPFASGMIVGFGDTTCHNDSLELIERCN